jgi:ABC-type multidrug transport system fused ATPase/permease subunit
MDEATAGFHQETDPKIQKMFKDELWSCTVLTIAHRLKTIII